MCGILLDIARSRKYHMTAAKRSLTIQLDDAIVRRARIMAARCGLSLTGFIAQQLTQLVKVGEGYERAPVVALEALTGATGGETPKWHREDLYDL
jgi:hypothetical protein